MSRLTHIQLTTKLNTRGNHNREGERERERQSNVSGDGLDAFDLIV